MARIRILMAVSGTNFQWSPGQVVDLPGEAASRWADGVRAELVRDDPIETAIATAPERTATAPRARRRTAR